MSVGEAKWHTGIYCAKCDVGEAMVVGIWRSRCARCTPRWLLDLYMGQEDETRSFTIDQAAAQRAYAVSGAAVPA